jgi:hypothetical protein
MAMLADLHALKELTLGDCALTGAAWLEVGKLTHLEQIYLGGATISSKTLHALHKMLPSCRFYGTTMTDEKSPVPDLSRESLWQQLHAQFPGQTDIAIASKLRNYMTVADADKGGDTDWIMDRLANARQQWQAVRGIERCPAHVYYDFQFDASHKLVRGAQSPVPISLREFLGEDFFHGVIAVESNAIGAERPRRGVTNRHNVLAPAADRWVVFLPGLPHLRRVMINDLTSDENLKYLADLSELKTLYLTYPTFTGEGLGRLKDLPQLRELSVTCAEGLTDAGLQSIAQLTQLRSLRLDHTQVVDEGIKKLRQALPNCRIED